MKKINLIYSAITNSSHFATIKETAVTKSEYGIEITDRLPEEKFEAAILAVAHDEFRDLDITSLLTSPHVIYDVKWLLPVTTTDGRL